jgi:tetratricopeptide (TPR) repeat protein
MLLICLGALTAAVRAGLTSYRAAASANDAENTRPVVMHLTSQEKQRYEYRLRQLEQDLRRDDSDYEVLRRLGQLHLQLAECEVDKKNAHLRQARYYLHSASARVPFGWDQPWIRGLLEVANSPNPVMDVANIPGDFGPPLREDPRRIRFRLGLFEEVVGSYPRDSRMLRRLGTSYLALYMVLSSRDAPRIASPDEGWDTISDPREVRVLAEQYFRRAVACARTHEARYRALYSEAQLYRVVNEPERAAALLDQCLALQPNNWVVALEAAALSRQLNLTEKADRFQAQSSRWRVPGWI